MAFGRYGFQAARRFSRRMARLRGMPGGESSRYWGGLIASVLVHCGAVVYALTHSLLPTPRGSIAATPPVSVEVVDTRMLQARDRRRAGPISAAAREAAGDARAVETPLVSVDRRAQPQSGGEVDTRPPGDTAPPLAGVSGHALSAQGALPVRAEKPHESTEPHRDETFLLPPPEQEPGRNADAGLLKPVNPGERTAPDAAKQTQPAPLPKPNQKTGQAQHGQRTRRGAATASVAPGAERQEAQAGQDSASRGWALTYRYKVLAHLAANRPDGGIGRGTVRIAFSLTRSGRLISAHVSRSSGKRAVDQAALESVRSASPYPPPPTQLKGSRHRFVFPFYFQ